ncbi:MAG: glgP, partial [Ilumatobacteraceae bacterium]|nr:glgP [Ilumatobacteraceae bacterium]
GWWDECYDGTNGWAIQSADDDPDYHRRDAREATSLFGLLEREVVPLFYAQRDGVPTGWIDKMKNNWRTLGPYVTAARMVRDYVTDLYEPGAASGRKALANDCATSKALASWKRRVRFAWPDVHVISVDADVSNAHEGDPRTVSAEVDLGPLSASDVVVQVLHGNVDQEGAFVGAPNKVDLRHVAGGTFEGTFAVGEAGPYGVTVRAMPAHPDLVTPVDLGVIAWAS